MTEIPMILTTELGDEPVVVKRSRTGAGNASILAELERLRAAAQPGVVRVLASTDAPIAGFATAYAGATTLASMRPQLRDLVRILAAVCDTLAALHGRGIVHGRLDATHVIVADGRTPILCGFGPGTSPARPADDVAAIGRLVRGLVGDRAMEEPIPDRRIARRAPWGAPERRAVLAIADHAVHHDPSARPTAAALALALRGLADGGREPEVGVVRRRTPLALTLGAIIATALVAAGGFVLVGGSTRSPDPALGGGAISSSSVAFDLLQVAALAAGAYLVATTVLAFAARALRSETLRRAGERITLPALRSLLAQVTGLSVSAALAVLATPGADDAASSPSPAPTIERLPDAAPTPAPTDAPAATPVPGPRADPPSVPVEVPEGVVPEPAPERSDDHDGDIATTPTAQRRAPTTHVVERGEHLWSIARSIVGTDPGAEVSDATIAPYWRALVEANPQLADPDVIRPGEVISLPTR